MASQSESPHEADIARRLLSQMGPEDEVTVTPFGEGKVLRGMVNGRPISFIVYDDFVPGPTIGSGRHDPGPFSE